MKQEPEPERDVNPAPLRVMTYTPRRGIHPQDAGQQQEREPIAGPSRPLHQPGDQPTAAWMPVLRRVRFEPDPDLTIDVSSDDDD